ncbi:MAG TPA: hypothetical protein VJH95_01115 [Candidatus Nanoarchaeia archaeon]|nr:hypothetical protein [Candidatus Nanoarchaeia archaeon]
MSHSALAYLRKPISIYCVEFLAVTALSYSTSSYLNIDSAGEAFKRFFTPCYVKECERSIAEVRLSQRQVDSLVSASESLLAKDNKILEGIRTGIDMATWAVAWEKEKQGWLGRCIQTGNYAYLDSARAMDQRKPWTLRQWSEEIRRKTPRK